MAPHNLWLLIDALAAVVALVLLIGVVKLHPFLCLVIVSLGLGLVAGMSSADTIHSFELGTGNTLGHIAIVIALGTILGKLMAESGGAEQIARTIVRRFGESYLPFAMLLIGLVVGLPVFFDVGFVLLIPIALTVARRTGKSLVLVALPMLAGLSIVHAFIPPHPAAMAAVVIFQANIGRTILYALMIGVPAAVLAGPVYALWISPRLGVASHSELGDQLIELPGETSGTNPRPLPSFPLTLATILLPVVLMLLGGWADGLSAPATPLNRALHLIGSPDIALLIAVLVGCVTFGLMQGISRPEILRLSTESLPPIAGVLLLIGAGGGFGRILIDSGISTAIVDAAQHAHLSVLVMAWLIAALVRVATGSSTVAMTTAASIIAPLALHDPALRPELLVIATGAGSIILSHVNDGGFWLTREYLGMTVPQTFKSWTVCETLLSLLGLGGVLLLSLVT
jgi:GntP family gluconate:H+ symporter